MCLEAICGMRTFTLKRAKEAEGKWERFSRLPLGEGQWLLGLHPGLWNLGSHSSGGEGFFFFLLWCFQFWWLE